MVLPISRGSVAGRAVLARQTLHQLDRMATRDEFPDSPFTHLHPESVALPTTPRTMLATPLARGRGDRRLLAVHHRAEVRPFTDQQIALVETFAAQAVIAIQNARLFQD